jgi:hypothetical protein
MDEKEKVKKPEESSQETLSRRKAIKRIAGALAVAAAGTKLAGTRPLAAYPLYSVRYSEHYSEYRSTASRSRGSEYSEHYSEYRSTASGGEGSYKSGSNP